MDKREAKTRIKSLLEAIGDLKDKVDELKSDAECERDEMEPYEGRSELTPNQEEKQEWLDNVASTLEELFDNLESSQGELEGYLE